MSYLLDVNVLVALLDPSHVHHDRAQNWFAVFPDRWATCPMTEAGVVRILSQPKYPNSLGSPSQVLALLSALRRLLDHEFWTDDLSLVDGTAFDTHKILHSSQITDTYLLALARTRDGQLATFDTRLSTSAVPDGLKYLYLIP